MLYIKIMWYYKSCLQDCQDASASIYVEPCQQRCNRERSPKCSCQFYEPCDQCKPAALRLTGSVSIRLFDQWLFCLYVAYVSPLNSMCMDYMCVVWILNIYLCHIALILLVLHCFYLSVLCGYVLYVGQWWKLGVRREVMSGRAGGRVRPLLLRLTR